MRWPSDTQRLPQAEERIRSDEMVEAAFHLPNPDEIERRAAEIRAGWTDRERRRRAGQRNVARLSPVRLAPADYWRWNDA